MGFDAISACYALSVAAGGIVGYVKAGTLGFNIKVFFFSINVNYRCHTNNIYKTLIILFLLVESFSKSVLDRKVESSLALD